MVAICIKCKLGVATTHEKIAIVTDQKIKCSNGGRHYWVKEVKNEEQFKS